MAITKTGREMLKMAKMEKRGIGITPLLLHFGQNGILRATMAHPEKSWNFIPKIFLRGVMKPNSGMVTPLGNLGFGAIRGALPEYGILHEHGNQLGTAIKDNLARLGVTTDQLTKRDMVAVAKMLKGDFTGAYNLKTPHAQKLVRATLESLLPGTGEVFANVKSVKEAIPQVGKFVKERPLDAALSYGTGEVLRAMDKVTLGLKAYNNRKTIASDISDALKTTKTVSPEQIQTLLGGVGQAIKENRLLGPLTRVLSERGQRAKLFNYATSGSGDTTLKKALRLGGDVAVSGALLKIDRPAEAFALVKRLGDWENGKNFKLRNLLPEQTGNTIKRWANKVDDAVPARKALGWANKNIADIFGGIPNEISFNRGLQGKETKLLRFDKKMPGRIAEEYRNGTLGKAIVDYGRDIFDSGIISPLTAASHDLSEGIGRAMHNAGLHPEDFSGVKNILERHNIVDKEPPTWVYNKYQKVLDSIPKIRDGLTNAKNKARGYVEFSKPEFSIGNPFK